MKLYHMVSGNGLGGPKQVYMDLHRAFIELGYTMMPVVRSGSSVHKFHLERSEDCAVVHGYIRHPLWLRSIKQLRQKLPFEGVMLLHKPIDAWFIRRARPKITIVLIVHGYHYKGVEAADFIIAVSQSVARYLTSHTQKPISVIPNMLADIPQDQSLDLHKPLQFGFLGFFRRKKGLTDLCHALRNVKGNYQVSVAGWGWQWLWLHFLKRIWGLNQLTIQSWVHDKDKWFENVDVFLLPSRSETFGLVILEALSRSKCVLATATGGPSEIIEPGKTGYIVPLMQPEKLAEAMQSLIDSPQKIQSVRHNARQSVIRNYSRTVVIQKWHEFFKDIIKEPVQPVPCQEAQ